MDLIKKINLEISKIKRYLKNRTFKTAMQNEKRKKYLFSRADKDKKTSLFNMYKGKNKFFSNLKTFKKPSLDISKIRFLYMGLGLILLSLSSYVIVISPYFRISPSKVIIERKDTITDINIAYKAIENIYGESIFLANTQEIAGYLKSYQKNIKNVTVSKLYPNGLKVIIESYPPQFFTQFAGIDKKYIVTGNGVLIYEKNIEKMIYNLEIVDNSLIENGFFDYKEGVDEQIMAKIIYTRDLFKDIFLNKNIAKFIYFKLENELHISLETGTIIITELGSNMGKQLAMLKFYNDNSKDILSSGDVSYLDIRSVGKIFVCKEKGKCKQNLARIYPEYYKK